MEQVSTATQPTNVPFVLLWAESLSSEDQNRPIFVFSPSASGMVEDPNSIKESSFTSTPPAPETADTSYSF